MGLLTRLLRPQPESQPEFAGDAAMKREIARLRGAYLGLIKDCLIGAIYEDPGTNQAPVTPEDREFKYEPAWRELGMDWPAVAHSMIGNRRMLNLWTVCEDVIAKGVPGDFIETGVWRGGACIFMRAILETYGVKDRTVWVADSFEGLPPPNEEQYPADRGLFLNLATQLAVSLEEVRRNFRNYGLLDDQVRFLKGWFKDTLHAAPIGRLAVLRLDGDLYESTMDALRALYHKLSPGGYAVIDDFQIDACKQAVADFRRENGIDEPIQTIDDYGVFWQKRPA
jgi:macrocin-O-methyltransferase TylF-like protien